MRPTVVLNVVGLTPKLLAHAPNLRAVAEGAGGWQAAVTPQLPAVTCTAQATMWTGKPASEHGIVANGWYFRDLSEIWLWRQSERLVQAPAVWDTAKQRDPAFTCAKLFWWFNMYSTADWAVTPRPGYPADGRKLFGLLHSKPAGLQQELRRALGDFPLFDFWGPRAGLGSSKWIADATQWVMAKHDPTLTLAYFPHLDYDLQRYGPDDPRAAAAATAIDGVLAPVIDAAKARNAAVLIVSEYGITPVTGAVHINRILRNAGYLEPFWTEGVGELIDAGAQRAFAVADHQLAHVYVRDAADLEPVAEVLRGTDGIAEVLQGASRAAAGLDHPNAGELVALSAPDRWFTYYYWLDDARAPDFARTVDIHRKPGYDPVELFLAPGAGTKLRIGTKVLKSKLGMRYLMDVIPLTPELVRGSHGRLPPSPEDGPVLLSNTAAGKAERLPQTAVHDVILATLFSD